MVDDGNNTDNTSRDSDESADSVVTSKIAPLRGDRFTRRRKADHSRPPIPVRNIHWQELATDIPLASQSALLLDALPYDGKATLQLMPQTLTAETAETRPAISTPFVPIDSDDGKITSIHSARQRQVAADADADTNANTTVIRTTPLRTSLSAAALRERCKAINVEGALVRSSTDKRLYLVAGFISWPAANLPGGPDGAAQNGAGTQAADSAHQTLPKANSPLLFFPVYLITRESAESTTGYEHHLEFESSVPVQNIELMQQLQEQQGVELPDVATVQQESGHQPPDLITRYLQMVHEQLVDLPGIALNADLGLGLCPANPGNPAEPAASVTAIKHLPEQFDASLARELVQDLPLSQLRTAINLLHASNEISLAPSADEASWPESPDIAEVREYAHRLQQQGIGNTEFQDLPDLPERVTDWIDDIQPVLKSSLITETLQRRDIKAINLIKLSGAIELIDKAPALPSHMHRDLAYRGTPLLFKRAKYQARLIDDEMDKLKTHFYLDRVPAKGQLLRLLEELGNRHDDVAPQPTAAEPGQAADGNDSDTRNHKDSDSYVVDSEYFNARRQFMDLCIEKPTSLTEHHRHLLGHLVKVLRFRELFVNNTEYRLALGPGYRGLRTDWDSLERLIDFAQEFSQVVGSEAIAAAALADWEKFRSSFIESLDSLRRASDALRNLLRLVAPADRESSSDEVMVRASALAEQLKAWNLEFGLMTNFGDKTPRQVLQLFSGRPEADSQADRNVRAASERIKRYLIGQSATSGDHSVERVSATLGWLQSAVSNESIALEELNRIIDSAP